MSSLMLSSKLRCFAWIALLFCSTSILHAQTAPAIGYMYPPGGQAGQTVDVILGGYDWTPDMELFVHDERIRLEILSPPGPVIIPEPPYWFGKKARRPPFLLPRETKARLTIPSNIAPGIVHWQAANANGASATGRFVVAGNSDELLEDDDNQLQRIPTLPATISGQIKKIEEVDRYKIVAEKSGPITCVIVARQIGSPLNASLEIHDSDGNKVARAVDTAGDDTAVTFFAKAKQSYTISLSDVDFRGNRAFVYRLMLTAAPRVVAAIPAAARRGETRQVELVGYGIKTGTGKLESVTKTIQFPADKTAKSFAYHLETPFGIAPGFSMLLSDMPEMTETTTELSIPIGVTGVLDERFGQDLYEVTGKKGERWLINLAAEKIGSPLDMALTILAENGQELARNDDRPGSTDAAMDFLVPAEGKYIIAVSDNSGLSGNRAAVYRLAIETSKPDFTLTVPELLNAPLGQKARLAIKAERFGGFKEAISISLKNLPTGVSTAKELMIPAGKTALNVELDVSANAAATSSLVMVVGRATHEGVNIVREATHPLLMATTIKPPFSIDAEGKDDVTKWPRGTTFPAPVLIQRDKGFNSEIILEMTSRQGRHRQGIRGPDLVVPPGIERILYPVFLPEWLETTRTSRMVVNGVAKVADPKGNIRYSLTRQKTRMGFLPTGALLKISVDFKEMKARIGEKFQVPISIRRSRKLKESIQLELLPGNDELTKFKWDKLEVPADQTQVSFPVTISAVAGKITESKLTIRATLLKAGKLPVVSETTVVVLLSE